MLGLLSRIHELLGEANARHLDAAPVELAKAYQVSIIHSTLAIEGSTIDKITVAELADDRNGSASSPEALEAVNTLRVHDLLDQFDPFNDQDLRHAHSVMMHGLATDAGHYRTGPMEVFYGEPQALRVAPAHGLPVAIRELLSHAEEDDFPPLITSCVLHFGLIYLRPFTAGNGRLARLWQRRFLMRQWPVFAYLPMEAFIHQAEPAYHAALEYADRRGDCIGFITYILERIEEALSELLGSHDGVRSYDERVAVHLIRCGRRDFRRKDYLATFPELSTATATRDLRDAVKAGLIEVRGSGRAAVYKIK